MHGLPHSDVKTWAVKLFGLVLCVCLAPHSALGREKIDVVLLRDVSASMLVTDPSNHSTEAMQLLLAMLDKQDRLAMLTFDQKTNSVSDFVWLQDQEKSRLHALMRNQGMPAGAYTNLYAALAGALERWDTNPRPDAQPLVVLFTDGKMDLGDKIRDEQLINEVENKIIPLYRSLGIKLYPVAFSDLADFDFLQRIAQKTGGLAIHARTPEDLPKIFVKVFEIAKKPEMLPIEGGSIAVDGDISELNILIDGQPKAGRLALVSPSGKVFLSEDKTHRITWLKQPHYSIISMDKPEPGTWILKGDTAAKRAYIITNIGLEARLADDSGAGGGKTIESWLEKDKNRISDGRILENADFTTEISSIEEPDKLIQSLRLHDDGAAGDKIPGDGIYSGLPASLPAGQFQAKITLDNKAFKRSKNLFFENAPLPAETAPPISHETAAPGESGWKADQPPAKPSEPVLAKAVDATPKNGEESKSIPIEGDVSSGIKNLFIVNGLVLGLVALSFGTYKFYKIRMKR